MSREDAGRGSGVGNEAAASSPAKVGNHLVLTDQEKSVLEFLIACKTAKTASQVCARTRLSREEVVSALDSLRTNGLVTRHNTLVESYAARFPGVSV